MLSRYFNKIVEASKKPLSEMTSRRPRRAPRPAPAPPAVELSLVALAENNRQLTAELVQRRAASVALSGAVRALKRRLIAATTGPTVADASTQMAFNSTAPRGFAPAGFAPCDPAAYAFDSAAVPNSIKLILGAVQGPRACELTYRGVQPLAIEEDSVAESAPPASGCFDLKLSDSLKDDDETQLDSARISPPKKKRRRGPEDHPSFLSSGIPVCSQDSVVSSRSYGDDAYLF